MIKKFYLPGYYIYFYYIQLLIEYRKRYPFYFMPDRVIAGAYDLPYGLSWNGGRGSNLDIYNEQKVQNIMEYYYSISDFTILHTCTNLYPNLNDELCNNFLDVYYRSQDKIIINNKELKNYLQNKYQSVSFVNSTTLGNLDIDMANNLSQYDQYVPYYMKNIDNNYLSQLKYKDHIEILCGEFCVPNCPMRHKHYEVLSKAWNNDFNALINFSTQKKCPNNIDTTMITEQIIKERPWIVSNQRINELNDMGFTQFKIAGRQIHPLAWVNIIIYYLIKPEYLKKVRQFFIDFTEENLNIKITAPKKGLT